MAITPTQTNKAPPLLATKPLVNQTAWKARDAADSMKRAASVLQTAGNGGQGGGASLTNMAEDTGELDDLIKTATAAQQQAGTQDLAQLQQKSGQDTKFTQQKAELAQKSVQAKEIFANQTDELLQKFEQQQDLLGLDRYKAEADQLLFGMRMQNDKYIDKLKMEGARLRLTDQASFKEAMANTIFADELGLLKSDLEFQKLLFGDSLTKQGALADDARAFEKQLSAMDLELALKVAFSENDAKSEGMRYGAISEMVGAIGKGAQQLQLDYKNEAKAAKSTPLSNSIPDTYDELLS
jgi:hypothetical protein